MEFGDLTASLVGITGEVDAFMYTYILVILLVAGLRQNLGHA